MEVRIVVETTFENGTKKTHRLGRLSRPFRCTQPEGFGLLLEDAKTIFGQLQKAILRDQIEEASEASRICPDCDGVRGIHDYRSRVLDTLFGRFQVKGLLQILGFSGIPVLFKRPAETLRWHLWHGKVMTATTSLQQLIVDCARLATDDRVATEAARSVQARCRELYSYLANNMDSLPDYGRRYRAGLPISSSRAEGCVDDIGNTHMGKRRRMRWSPKGAHRVAVVRAAVLDGRLTGAYQKAAA